MQQRYSPTVDEEVLTKLRSLFSPEGELAAQFSDWEHRPGQLVMAQQVLQCYLQGGTTLIEAGTGTGKSLAYLIPALLWSQLSGEKVIISTNTSTLQEQLLHNDIPLARRALNWDFPACLVKGWSNYVCLLKLRQTGTELDLFQREQITQLDRILTWAEVTEDGTLADLDFAPDEDIWESVCAESDLCTRGQCPYYSRCFYFAARRKIRDATVLLVNHHLLFADLAVRRVLGFDTDRAILPRYYHVIFDEAHHLEDVATNYLGVEQSSLGLTRMLRRIHRSGRRTGSGGLVGRLLRLLGQGADGEDDPLARLLQWEIPATVRQVRELGHGFFQQLHPLCLLSGEGTFVVDGSSPTNPIYDETVFDAYSRLQQGLVALSRYLKQVVEEVDSRKDEWEEGETLHAQAKALANRVVQYQKNLEFLYNADADNYVFWLETMGRGHRVVRFCAAPIVVAQQLRENLLQYLVSVICTSATLTAGGRFDYLIDSLGLVASEDIPAPEPLTTAVIESPYDYKQQVLLGLPQDLPEPGSSKVVPELTSFLLDVLNYTKGKTFVLFTSHRMLEEVAQRLRGLAKGLGISLLCQGQAPRRALLEEFTSGEPAVLLGTDSFWEGVDGPGDALSCVVIVKLPFKVPTEPVTEARIEAMERQGRNSFREYVLPHAVIKLKQGFGRLVRTKTDRGVVLICDPRIMTKAYGRVFIQSLPECTLIQGSRSEVMDGVRRWI